MRHFPLVLVAALLLAACAPADDEPPAGTGTEPVLVARNEAFDDLPPMTVSEALAAEDDQQVVVSGALFVDADGAVRLCEAVAESFPPQCGGSRIVVEDLDLAGVAGLQEENGVQWAESVQVFGSIQR